MVLITPNQRLSAYFQAMPAWADFHCVPVSDWVTQTYQKLYRNSGQKLPWLLSDTQSLIVWEQIIRDFWQQSPQEFSVFSYHQLANIAYEAWRLLQQWQVPLSPLLQMPSEETKAFLTWAQAFQDYCQQRHYVDSSRCVEYLLTQCEKQPILGAQQLIVAGFDEIPPQIQALLCRCSSKKLRFYQSEMQTDTVQRVALLDLEQELQTMAAWANQQVTRNPQARIGCVIPQLSLIRDKVHRAFSKAISSEAGFNISAGESFAAYPMIDTARQILQLGPGRISLEEISTLLRSPFIGDAETEKIARAQWDVVLRKRATSELSLVSALNFAEKTSSCPEWLAYGRAYLASCAALPTRQSPSEWARHFTAQLESFGWPGERSLTSDEYQQLQRWQALLEEFASFDLVHDDMDREQACYYLGNLTQNILFQAQTPPAPIQILGVLEAAGMLFDQLWVMGMNDQTWPQPPAPNPFIPVHIQRKFNMPHASAQRELDFSRRLTERFCHSAKQVQFSYSQFDGDLPLACSPLLQEVTEVAAEAMLTPHPPSAPSPTRGEGIRSKVYEESAPPVVPGQVPGGTNVLKEQAACPFRAFARIRLGAAKLPPIKSTLLPQERGALLHEMLDRVWAELKDHKTLLQQSAEDLELLIARAVASALRTYNARALEPLPPQFQAVESQRLQELAKEWLELEKQRPPFLVIAREAQHEVELGQLNFKLRIDRVDQLADGSQIIIDYKTGQPRIEDWFGERPDDPQLPLYCLQDKAAIDGLVFAQIRAEKLLFKGISAAEISISGVQTIAEQRIDPAITTWEAFKNSQHQKLTQIAAEFQAGIARVDPKYQEQTCRQCDLHMLCRIAVPSPTRGVVE